MIGPVSPPQQPESQDFTDAMGKPAATWDLYMGPERVQMMIKHAAKNFVLTLHRRDRISISANAMRSLFEELMGGSLTEINGKPVMRMPEGFETSEYGEWVEIAPALDGWIDYLGRIAPHLSSAALIALKDALVADQEIREFLVIAARIEFEAHVDHMKTMAPSSIDEAVKKTRAEWRKAQQENEEMNTPTEIPVINDVHAALSFSSEAMSSTDIAGRINNTTKPTKQQIKSAMKDLKELASLGMIEMEPRAGGVPFYRLITTQAAARAEGLEEKASDSEGSEVGIADRPVYTEAEPLVVRVDPDSGAKVTRVANFATDEDLQYLEPEDYEMPPADPALLAMANRALSEQLDEFRAQLSSIAETVAPYLPDPSYISTARAVEILDMLAEAQAKHTRLLELELVTANSFADGLKRTINELRTHAVEQAAQHKADVDRLTGELKEARDDFAILRSENLALKTIEDAMPGFGAEHQTQRINSLTNDVLNTRNALTDALTEAERLRAELADERQARQALQEQSDSVDVKDAAVGYLIRVPKREPIMRLKPESARAAALSAVRGGASKAEVLAVVPVGTARRGAEWGNR